MGFMQRLLFPMPQLLEPKPGVCVWGRGAVGGSEQHLWGSSVGCVLERGFFARSWKLSGLEEACVKDRHPPPPC